MREVMGITRSRTSYPTMFSYHMISPWILVNEWNQTNKPYVVHPEFPNHPPEVSNPKSTYNMRKWDDARARNGWVTNNVLREE
jgi:hypothetical protein